MAGPNLELVKFSIYLFFPLAIMVHYGDPQWYHDNVLPVRNRFWPDEASLYVSEEIYLHPRLNLESCKYVLYISTTNASYTFDC